MLSREETFEGTDPFSSPYVIAFPSSALFWYPSTFLDLIKNVCCLVVLETYEVQGLGFRV